MSNTCHDFKTFRVDASRRLPPIFSLVPVLFYITLLAGAYFNVTSYLTYRKALQNKDTWRQTQSTQQQAKLKTETEKAGILKEKTRAEKLAEWVEGTRTLQPITVAIDRALPPEITMGSLTMERSLELPSQIILTIHLNNGTVEDVGHIQQGIGSLNYRPFNAQQTKNGDTLEYRSMLVWQDIKPL